MWTCYINNIYLLFLPAHASHVLQPLDLSVFSPLKTAYRCGIDDLALMTDSAPIGKRLFLCCYSKARSDAITERNIRSGWKASGLWPVNVDKPLMSRLLLPTQPTQPTQPAQPNQPTQPTQPNQPTQPTQPTQPSSQGVNKPSSQEVKTPSRSQEVHKLVATNYRLKRLKAIDPVARTLFAKVGKSLDYTAIQLASQQQRIRALEAEVDRLKPRKKKKVRLDPNTRFAQIEQIMQAKKALAEELKPSEVVNSYVLEDMCLEWSIFDPPVDTENGGADGGF